MGQDGGPSRGPREGRCDCQRRSRACWTGARHVPRPWVRVGPRTPALQHSLADGPQLRRNVPDSAAGPRLPGRRPGRPGTCGRRVPATPRLSGVRGAPSPARASPGRVLRLLPGRAGVGPASPRPARPPAHGPCAGTYRARPLPRERVPRGSMALPDPRVRPRRLAAPPRKWTPAARLGRPGPPPARGWGRHPAGKKAPRPQPRAGLRGTNERAQAQASGGQGQGRDVGGGGHTSAPQNPKPNLDATGKVGGPRRPQMPPRGLRPQPLSSREIPEPAPRATT